MSITWEKSQNYSNLAPGAGGNDNDSYPGFWFGPETLPNPQTGNVFNTRLNPNSQITRAQPIYQVAMFQGANVSKRGDRAVAVMHIPNSNMFAITYLSYIGSFSYKDVYPPTPAVIAEFSIQQVQFVEQVGTGRQYVPIPADEQPAGVAALNQAINSSPNYIYFQLVPNTGYESVEQHNPATPGSTVVLSNVDWDFDAGAPNIDIACFLPGSMITTHTGPKAVETLAVGDLVLTGPAGKQTPEAITWIGRGHVEVQPDLPDDRAGYAVCISKGALGENCPNADLHLTAEHTLYFDGRFVPVRMLVNHRSIFYDRSLLSYDYYHFETAEHSIVHANNVVTESYLNTESSRRNFHDMDFLQQGNIVAFPPPSKSWEKDACAPLAVDAAFVRPLYERLDERARSLGFARQVPPLSLIQDSDLHLMTDTGEILYPIRRVQDRAVFLLPEGVKVLRLRSRTSRPCDAVGPYIDDRRFLGVLVGTVELYQNGQTHHLTSHLTDQHATGWDVVEACPCRWTNGNAILSLSEGPSIRERDMLSIQILAEGPYIDETQTETSTIALPQKVAMI